MRLILSSRFKKKKKYIYMLPLFLSCFAFFFLCCFHKAPFFFFVVVHICFYVVYLVVVVVVVVVYLVVVVVVLPSFFSHSLSLSSIPTVRDRAPKKKERESEEKRACFSFTLVDIPYLRNEKKKQARENALQQCHS